MPENQFKHTDNDGDTLEVQQGIYSAVFTVTDSETYQQVQVAVRKTQLAGLIATLQAIEPELEES